MIAVVRNTKTTALFNDVILDTVVAQRHAQTLICQPVKLFTTEIPAS